MTYDDDEDDHKKDESFYPSGSDESSTEKNKKEIKSKLEFVISDILRNPKYYLGIPISEMHIIDLLQSFTNISQKDIFIVLRKIRRNEEMETLADLFDTTKQNISHIFSKNVVQIAACIKDLIYWPKPLAISNHLPLAFKNRFKNVQSIIDCFEIKIEKPSNPMLQALSWSSYKQANTFKYLISCTPDCVINFISKGYGGRITDPKILKLSGYLDKLPQNCSVMGNRGFKYAHSLFTEKNCKLIRPPSVKANERPDKRAIKESKQISSVRIHIEREIGRVREFKMLSPSNILDHNYFHVIDSIVEIACGLSNLQGDMLLKN